MVIYKFRDALRCLQIQWYSMSLIRIQPANTSDLWYMSDTTS